MQPVEDTGASEPCCNDYGDRLKLNLGNSFGA
jgi:hypothetical protein